MLPTNSNSAITGKELPSILRVSFYIASIIPKGFGGLGEISMCDEPKIKLDGNNSFFSNYDLQTPWRDKTYIYFGEVV